ncbi:MAG: ABC transporter ATP-binding protein [Clostridia bacterium]|nr:ABC transporter ATP-binding protein [Clostridia bacterium]
MHIDIEHIRRSFGRKTVLQDISLSVSSGMCIGILGGNGSGKSTLLSILAGVLTGDGGSFLCDGTDLLRTPKQRETIVGYVPQGTPLFGELNALDNLRLWYPADDLRLSLDQGVLAMLGIPAFLKTPVNKMSGGMKKRLAIGCAVAKDPQILLMDEPTSALDLACKQIVAAYLNEHRQNGGITLLTTHDTAEFALCDKLYILRDGVLAPYEYDGNMRELVDLLS